MAAPGTGCAPGPALLRAPPPSGGAIAAAPAAAEGGRPAVNLPCPVPPPGTFCPGESEDLSDEAKTSGRSQEMGEGTFTWVHLRLKIYREK